MTTAENTQSVPNSLDDSSKDPSPLDDSSKIAISLDNSTKSVPESLGDSPSVRKDAVPLIKSKSTLLSICSFIIANEFCERMAFYGFTGSLVLFLTKELNFTSANADINTSIWTGVCYVTPLLGGWLADSYLGRFNSILGFCVIYLLGMIVVSIVAWPDTRNIYAFFIALYLVALGTGGIKSNVSTFGADQFDDANPRDRKEKESFFNYFYLSINLGAFISFTIIAYLCQNVSFGVGYLIPAAAMAFSLFVFWLGRYRYKRTPPQGSILRRFIGVIIEGCRSRQRDAPTWLDRASNVHGGSFEPQEVQDARAVLRLLPYAGFLIVYWAIYAQMGTTFFNQGCQMDLKLGNVQIPIAALGLFDCIALIILIPLFDRVFYPLIERYGFKLTMLKKMGIGMIFATLAMLTAGFVEMARLRDFHEGKTAGPSVCFDGDSNPPLMTDTSIFWQTPQFFLIGASEVFTSITGLQFFYTQAPTSMKSVCAAINLLTTAIGTWIAAVLIPIVNADRNNQWITTDVNHGHLDWFFFVLAGLSALNAIFFTVTARNYTYVPTPVRKECTEEETKIESSSKAGTDNIDFSTKSRAESQETSEAPLNVTIVHE